MSQRGIIDYLKKNPENWVNRDEIIKELGITKNTFDHNVLRLVSAGEIERTYERVDNPEKPKTKRIVTWIKLT